MIDRRESPAQIGINIFFADSYHAIALQTDRWAIGMLWK